jgi:DNA invertase Pin-like site-specific DNA recombinase
MIGMLGIFSEFKREMIVARVKAGLARARETIARDVKRLGRPSADPKKIEAARCALAKGADVLKTPKLVGFGTGAVQSIKQAFGPIL